MSHPSEITDLLPELLASVERPGDFYGEGAAPLPIVRIAVEGVGLLGLPIPAVQAEALARIAEPAPYGRGPDTLIDRDVRRCGQIPADAVTLEDPRWHETLGEVIRAASAALGVAGGVSARLYKMLVYGPGDFFVEHRDTEKESRMFATLIVALPSEHEGGELVIRHRDREVVVGGWGEEIGVARWAAFFSDCQHELRPVRRGHRVVLVYNLVRRGGERPIAPDYGEQIERVAAALRAWGTDPEGPVKIVYPLAHHYTPAELSFAALKNADAAQAAVLVQAAARADCVARLAMISIRQSGSAEPVWSGSWQRRYEVEEFEVIEVVDETWTLEDWRRPDDTPDPLGAIEIEPEELAPEGELDDEEPDEEHFHEATGNEGGSFERTYRRAALVVWPEARTPEVLVQGGPETALSALERLLSDPGAREAAAALALALVDDWPRPAPEAYWPTRRHLHARALEALARLPDTTLLESFIEEVLVGSYTGDEAEALVAALGRLPADRAGALVRDIVRSKAATRFRAAAKLLRRAAEDRPGPHLRAAAETLAGAVPTAVPAPAWQRQPRHSEELVELVRALDALSALDLLSAVADRVRAHPAAWPVDDALLPAVLTLHESGSAGLRAALEPLRSLCVAHLQARVAEPLEPPPDAARSADGVTCRCGDCRALRAFLADRQATTWVLKAVQDRRRHVEQVIRQAGVDVDCRTERRGSPHSLICTKNRRSHERRVQQRAADVDALARLTL